MKNLLLATLTFASINAFAVADSVFQQIASCTYTDDMSKTVTSVSLLADVLADNEARARGLIIFKDAQQPSGKRADMAELTSVNMKDAKKVVVTLSADNLVDLSSKHGNKLKFDGSGKAKLETDYGRYECQLVSAAE